MTGKRAGVTLIELCLVTLCLAFLLKSLWQVVQHGTSSALKGMLRVETTLEARRVLKQVTRDLEHSCQLQDANVKEWTLDRIVARHDGHRETTYSFLLFSGQGNPNESINPSGDPGTGRAFTKASQVTYRLSQSQKTGFKQLLRVEQFHPDTAMARKFPGGQERILSEKINFFTIEAIHLPGTPEDLGFFQVTLQIIDQVGRKAVSRAGSAGFQPKPGADVVIADFFELVSSRHMNFMARPTGFSRNWHSGVSGP